MDRTSDRTLIDYFASVGIIAVLGASLDESKEDLVWCLGYASDSEEAPSWEFESRREVWWWWRGLSVELARIQSFAVMVGKGCRRGRVSAQTVRAWAENDMLGIRPDLVSNMFRVLARRPAQLAPGWLTTSRRQAIDCGVETSFADAIRSASSAKS